MKVLAPLSVSFAMMLLPVPAYTQRGVFMETGNDVLDACTATPGSFNEATCIGFIAGVVRGIAVVQRLPGNAARVCIPDKVTVQQEIDVAVQSLRSNPAQRQLDGGALVWHAFATAFPCASQK